MGELRTQTMRHWAAAATAMTLLAGPTGAAAVPPASASPAAPAAPDQEEPQETEQASTDPALVAVGDVDANGSAADVANTLAAMNVNVSEQLDQLDAAQDVVGRTTAALTDADAAVQNTQLRIEELTADSDEVVIDAFINPPSDAGFDVFAADSVGAATVKQYLLDNQADHSADVLAALDAERARFEELEAAQEAALADAVRARDDADQALADLRAAVSQRTQFVLQVRRRLSSDSAEADRIAAEDPDRAAELMRREAEINDALAEIEAEQAYARALEQLAEAEQRAIEQGTFLCPVRGDVHFDDTWGAARSGGRTHEGVDMMAPRGTPTVAPVSGRVEHRSTSLGGLSWYVYGDDGNMYYGTHLNSYENVGAGWVAGGTVIGYVGTSGNAPDDLPHLHFEFHPGGGAAVNPYSRVLAAC